VCRNFDVLKPVIGHGVFVLGGGLDHHDFRGDGIAGSELAEHRRWLDFVRHGHGVHEAGDVVAVDDRGLGLGVDRNDAAGKGIALGRRFRAMAGGDENSKRKEECGEKNASVRLMVHVDYTLTLRRTRVPRPGIDAGVVCWLFFRPYGARPAFAFYPRFAPWDAFFRRCAAAVGPWAGLSSTDDPALTCLDIVLTHRFWIQTLKRRLACADGDCLAQYFVTFYAVWISRGEASDVMQS
jgi:hypothetical protein